MGDYADDLRSEPYREPLSKPKKTKRAGDYRLDIVNRRTLESQWWCVIEASNKKDARVKFRLEYSDVREMYDGRFALTIRKVQV